MSSSIQASAIADGLIRTELDRDFDEVLDRIEELAQAAAELASLATQDNAHSPELSKVPNAPTCDGGTDVSSKKDQDRPQYAPNSSLDERLREYMIRTQSVPTVAEFQRFTKRRRDDARRELATFFENTRLRDVLDDRSFEKPFYIEYTSSLYERIFPRRSVRLDHSFINSVIHRNLEIASNSIFQLPDHDVWMIGHVVPGLSDEAYLGFALHADHAYRSIFQQITDVLWFEPLHIFVWEIEEFELHRLHWHAFIALPKGTKSPSQSGLQSICLNVLDEIESLSGVSPFLDDFETGLSAPRDRTEAYVGNEPWKVINDSHLYLVKPKQKTPRRLRLLNGLALSPPQWGYYSPSLLKSDDTC